MWVSAETSSFAGLLEASFNPLTPWETSNLKRTPFVQNTIDECFPPILSSRIWHQIYNKYQQISQVYNQM